jgi:hypothetical protein
MSTVYQEFHDNTGIFLVTPDPEAVVAAGEPDGYTVQVTVRDSGGNPLEGVFVWWEFNEDLVDCVERVGSGYTGVDGQVTLTGAGGGMGLSRVWAGSELAPVALTPWVTTRGPDHDGVGGDGTVGIADLIDFEKEFFGEDSPEHHDYDESGFVNVADMVLFAASFLNGSSCTPPAAGGGSPALLSDPAQIAALQDLMDAARKRLVDLDPEEARAAVRMLDALEARLSEAGATAGPAGPLLVAAPNPFRSEVVIRFGLPGDPVSELSIFDVAGRRIRAFPGDALAGVGELVWDGRDGAGRPAPAGIYFVRIVGSSGEGLTRKIVLRR